MPESKALITQTQSTSLVLSRTTDLLTLTERLINDKLSIIEDHWRQRLWGWADEHGIDAEKMRDMQLLLKFKIDQKRLNELVSFSTCA